MSDVLNEVAAWLRKIFAITITIAALFFVIDVVLHIIFMSVEPPFLGLKTWGYFLFVISIFTGVGVPILLRSSFQRKAAENKTASLEGFKRLQYKLLITVFISCLSADLAYLFPVQTLYLYGAFFSCLYGIYSVIPYKKKIAAELKFYKLV